MSDARPAAFALRRRLLRAAAGGAAVGAAPHWAAAAAGGSDAPAFAADRVERAIALLVGAERPAATDARLLTAPDLFEDGAFVPVTVGHAAVRATRLALLVDQNPTPLAAVFDIAGPVDAAFGVRVKMAQTSPVRVLAWPAGVVAGAPVEAHKAVEVVQGGCGDEPIAGDGSAARQPGAMRLRAQAAGNAGAGAVVRVLMRHPMETGLRKDAAGRPVPAWFIDRVEASLNGRLLFTAAWGNAIAADPYLDFSLPTAVAGDRVRLAWTDTRGGRRADEAVVG